MTSSEQAAALAERSEDDAFVQRLHQDPIGTLRSEGYDEFASDVEDELAKIDGLLRRMVGDDEFRQLVEEQPVATLSEWGLPEPAFEPVLAVLGAPDDVIERASAEVEAHGKPRQVSTAAAAAILGALAFAQSATAASPSQIQPNPRFYASPSQIQPDPRYYGNPSQMQPNPRFYSGPSHVRLGHPDAVRYYLASLRAR